LGRVFDLLVVGQARSLVGQPFRERRDALERFWRAHMRTRVSLLRLSPHTTDRKLVDRWRESLGEGLDGVIAKRLDISYRSADRSGMQKWKLLRSADCVVGGFRYGTGSTHVGSLLRGLYNAEGLLDHVGFTANMPSAEKPQLTGRLERLIEPPGFTGQAPGGPSRWSGARSTEWQPLAPKLVVEVQYDHFSGGRFRHGTRFLRWRPDKAPERCTVAQVVQESRTALALIAA
jgi:ATP-dependent DNA ligase